MDCDVAGANCEAAAYCDVVALDAVVEDVDGAVVAAAAAVAVDDVDCGGNFHRSSIDCIDASMAEVFCKRLCPPGSKFSALMLVLVPHSRPPFGFLDRSLVLGGDY